MHPITTENLSKVYKERTGKTKLALDRLNLAVQKAEVFGFLGPNGAGKSTTIKILMGLITPSGGTALLNGLPVTNPRSRQKVGFLPEHPTFYDYLTAQEYLAFSAGLHGMKKSALKAQSKELLTRLALWEVRDKQLRQYSKGMVQRLGLAQALIHDPEVLILDEPMSGLDPLGRALVKEIILELKAKGKCVFLSSHIIADVERICDRIGIVAQGRLLAVEQVSEVMKKGISGYLVHFVDQEGKEQERQVAKEEILGFLADPGQRIKEIRLIEPVRKDLERHFLDLVAGGAAS